MEKQTIFPEEGAEGAFAPETSSNYSTEALYRIREMIHLVNMPFASVYQPSLALGLIKSQLSIAGIRSRVFDLNIRFASELGFSVYEKIANFRGSQTQLGELLFAEQAWDDGVGLSDTEFLRLWKDEFPPIDGTASSSDWILRVRNQLVPTFLNEALSALECAADIRLVAFTCTFFQTIPALALARLLKRRFPWVRTIFGGACFHGEMGQELINKITWIDAASTGEADDVIVPLFQRMLNNQAPNDLQGVWYRDGKGDVRSGSPARPVCIDVFQALPEPDFSDYFGAARFAGLLRSSSEHVRSYLPFESSRGCWWGQKKQCTFCGLNGAGMPYRAKSGERVFETIMTYKQRYPVRRFRATDNIFSMTYFKTLLPMLQSSLATEEFELFYEVKANLSRQQVKALADAGIRYLQPGIESLSSHLLLLMRKGLSALQNVFLLKCAREYGILVFWNNLVRIPGETVADYTQMESWIPKLVHLQPPNDCARKIELHRFSPYFLERGKRIENVQPMKWYQSLFPKNCVDLARVAYYFEADWKDILGDGAYEGLIKRSLDWIRTWGEAAELPKLAMTAKPQGRLEIDDTRFSRQSPRHWQLDPIEAKLYSAIDKPVTVLSAASKVNDAGECKLAATEVRSLLDHFVKASLALREGEEYLALALPSNVPQCDLGTRRALYDRLLKQIDDRWNQKQAVDAQKRRSPG